MLYINIFILKIMYVFIYTVHNYHTKYTNIYYVN